MVETFATGELSSSLYCCENIFPHHTCHHPQEFPYIHPSQFQLLPHNRLVRSSYRDNYQDHDLNLLSGVHIRSEK